MLRVYHSNRLDLLKDLLLHLQTIEPLKDPLSSEQVLVQSPGMAQWLKQELALAQGIAANVVFPLPASFIWQLYVDLLPDVPKDNTFTKPAMSWKLWQLLPDYMADDFENLSDTLRVNTSERQCYILAQSIADLFDQYLVYRPEWIQAWQDGAQLGAEQADQSWQPQLWRALVDLTQSMGQSVCHRASLYFQLLALLQRPHLPDKLQQQLPQRLFVFGIAALPPPILNLLRALAQHTQVHMLLPNPSRYYWGDIIDQRWLDHLRRQQRQQWQGQPRTGWLKTAAQLTAGLEPQEAGKSLVVVGNSLLASLGKLERDFLSQLAAGEQAEVDAFVEPTGSGLLAAIQTDILNLCEGSVVLAQPDLSIRIHSCHSPLRELEVLHDQLLALFDPDAPEYIAGLSPRNIVVMVPDLLVYSPLIDAVFAARDNRNQCIPYAIGDRPGISDQPVIASFLALLALPDSRMTVTEVMDLLRVQAIARTCNIAETQLDTIGAWLDDAAIHWGLEAASGQPANHGWQRGLQRLVLAYTMGSHEPYSNLCYAGNVPTAPIAGTDGPLLGALIAFVERLADYRQQLSGALPGQQWIILLGELLVDFYPANESVAELSEQDWSSMQMLRAQLQILQQELHHAGLNERAITGSIILDWFKQQLQRSCLSQSYLTGRVNFCTLMPMRAIPFKVVGLLGMNDSDYPRNSPVVSFDLMATQKRPGDRCRRDDDRFLFLEALLAAQERLLISYVGQDVRDNSVRSASVLVSELLAYCDRVYPLGASTTSVAQSHDEDWAARLTQRHPLHPYGAVYFESVASNWFSYAEHWAIESVQPLRQATPFLAAESLPSPVIKRTKPIELSELLTFFRHPVRYYCQRQLGLQWSQLQLELTDEEPFAVTGLDRYQLQQELLATNLVGRTTDDTLLASGRLPAAPFGAFQVAQYRQDLAAQLRQLDKLDLTAQPQFVVHFDSLAGLLNGQLEAVTTAGLVHWRPGKATLGDLLSAWVQHCVYCQQEVACPSSSPRVTRLLDSHHTYQFQPLNQSQAAQQLQQLLQCYVQGCASPICWLEQAMWIWFKQLWCPPTTDQIGYLQSAEAVLARADKMAAKAYTGGYRQRGDRNDSYIKRCFPHWCPELLSAIRQLAQVLLVPLYNQLQIMPHE